MKIILLALVFVVTGCAIGQPKYTAPRERGSLPSKVYKVNAPFEKVWTSLIESTRRKFFTIKNIDKDSGLLTLSFGSTQPRKYVDCGKTPVQNQRQMVSYIRAAKVAGTVELLGTANLSMKSIDSGETDISFNTHYDLKIIDGDLSKQTWNFSTNEILSKKVGKLAVTCLSTFVAEIDIVSGINSIVSSH